MFVALEVRTPTGVDNDNGCVCNVIQVIILYKIEETHAYKNPVFESQGGKLFME